MAHYNLYDSIGLDSSKDTAALAAEIDERIRSGNTWNRGGIEELQVARAVLGNASRRAAYDHKLSDPHAPDVTVDSLRRLANVNFDANPAAPAYQYSPSTTQPASPAPAPETKKRPVWPWIAAAAGVLAAAGGGFWFLANSGTEWDETHAQVAADFPALIAEKDGGKGYLSMTCTSRETEGEEEAKIRCENAEIGLNIYHYGSAEQRDAVVGGGEPEFYGNDVCQFTAVEIPDQAYPTYYIAPNGDWDTYLLLLNGEDAEKMKTRLPIC
ncbi:hypothetical protein V6D40_05730 [Corynebacterium sp. Q4381]|uniref:hypothetical protein n=1 Tax=Corynebacterium sp. Marseille-Q4381 TaxID=3121597 RepID=UPI002FE64C3E